MKFFIVLTVAMLAVHVIGAPSNSTDTMNDIEAEKVKTDIISPMNDVTDLVMEEEKPRTKKAISPQTVCMEVKDNNGLSHLQCDDQLGSSSTYGGASYAPAPPTYSSSSSSSGYASPPASYGGYGAPAPKPSYSSYPSPSAGYSAPSGYMAPAPRPYSAPAPRPYSAPAQRPYSAPAAPSYGGYAAPAQPSYGSYREMNQAQAEHEQMMMAFAQMDSQIGAPQPSYGPPPPSYGAPPPSAAYSPPAYVAKPSYAPVAPGPAYAYRFINQITFVFLMLILFLFVLVILHQLHQHNVHQIFCSLVNHQLPQFHVNQ